MAKTRNHPKRHKGCVFCNFWTGDAQLNFINSTVGYEYELTASGKCMKRNAATKTHTSCAAFTPSVDAAKLM